MIKPVHNDKRYSINTIRTKQGKKYKLNKSGQHIGTFSRAKAATSYAIADSRK